LPPAVLSDDFFQIGHRTDIFHVGPVVRIDGEGKASIQKIVQDLPRHRIQQQGPFGDDELLFLLFIVTSDGISLYYLVV